MNKTSQIETTIPQKIAAVAPMIWSRIIDGSNRFRSCESTNSLQRQIDRNRLVRVPVYCTIGAVGWSSFGIFYFLRGWTITSLICAVVTVLLSAIGIYVYRNPEQRKRFANIHLAISFAGLAADCFLSGLSTSSTIPLFCGVCVIAAHQSGIRSAVSWTMATITLVVAMHFAFDPADWPQVRTENPLDNAVGYAGLFTLVTWMAIQAEWSASKYFEQMLNSLNDLAHLASHDQLTQLANRHRYRAKLESSRAAHFEDGQSFGLLILDLDSFKKVNDKLGHAAGDELLTRAADRLRACINEDDFAARIGGDEFTVIVDEATPERLRATATAISNSFCQPFQIGKEEIPMSVSIGGAMLPDNTRCIDELQSFADLAVYSAKKSGTVFEHYSPAMTEKLARKRYLANRIDLAIEKGEFSLVYQPQVCVATNSIIGVEALLRLSLIHI